MRCVNLALPLLRNERAIIATRAISCKPQVLLLLLKGKGRRHEW